MNKRQEQIAVATDIALRAEDLHPFHVAIKAACADGTDVPDFDAFIVGLLHDSYEDGYATYAELEPLFDSGVLLAVATVTRNDGEKYADYIQRIKDLGSAGDVGRIARKVKLADARINLARCQSNFGYDSLAKRYRFVIEELS